MSMAPEAVLKQALALSPEDRAMLASGLLSSLDDEPADDAEVIVVMAVYHHGRHPGFGADRTI